MKKCVKATICNVIVNIRTKMYHCQCAKMQQLTARKAIDIKVIKYLHRHHSQISELKCLCVKIVLPQVLSYDNMSSSTPKKKELLSTDQAMGNSTEPTHIPTSTSSTNLSTSASACFNPKGLRRSSKASKPGSAEPGLWETVSPCLIKNTLFGAIYRTKVIPIWINRRMDQGLMLISEWISRISAKDTISDAIAIVLPVYKSIEYY